MSTESWQKVAVAATDFCGFLIEITDSKKFGRAPIVMLPNNQA